MKVFLDPWGHIPTRAHDTDAGLDLYSAEYVELQPHSSAVIDTGVHVELPEHTAGLLVSKSGLNVNYGITSTGLIDEGYIGSIKVKLYNHGDKRYVVENGQKISQLVIIPVCYDDVEIVDALNELRQSERGHSGFGSTGK